MYMVLTCNIIASIWFLATCLSSGHASPSSLIFSTILFNFFFGYVSVIVTFFAEFLLPTKKIESICQIVSMRNDTRIFDESFFGIGNATSGMQVYRIHAKGENGGIYQTTIPVAGTRIIESPDLHDNGIWRNTRTVCKFTGWSFNMNAKNQHVLTVPVGTLGRSFSAH